MKVDCFNPECLASMKTGLKDVWGVAEISKMTHLFACFLILIAAFYLLFTMLALW